MEHGEEDNKAAQGAQLYYILAFMLLEEL